MRSLSSQPMPTVLLASALVLLGCGPKGSSQTPEDEPEASSPATAQSAEATDSPAGCEQVPVNDDVIRIRNHALDYSFLAILPPLRVDCDEPEALIVQNHDGLLEWSLTAIGMREPLDEQAFLEALWRKNEAASGPQRRVFGGGLEVTPQGHVVLSYLARTPGVAGGQPKTTVIFVNLRQRSTGEAFLLRMIAEVEPNSDPELMRARMRGPFMPLLDGFVVDEAAGR